MKKKIIKFIVILIILIAGLILVENVIRGLSRVTEQVKTNNEIKKEQEKYENSEDYVVDTYLDNCIQKTIDYLKAEDYETIYNLLDANYKDFMRFESIEDFKTYMNKYIGNPTLVSLVSNYRNDGKYVCKISVLNKEGLRTHTVLVKPINDEEFSIIFDNISYIKKLDDYYSYFENDIKAHSTYKVRYSDHLEYALDITNNTTKTISGSLAETYLLKSNKVSYYPINDNSDLNIEVKPNETVRVKLMINDAQVSYFEDQFLKVILKDINGNEIMNGMIVLAENYWE